MWNQVFLTNCLAQRLDKALREKHSGDKKRHEQLQSTLSQTLTTTLSGKLDKAVKAEVKSAVVPSVQKVLNSLQEQLNTTLAQVSTKITASASTHTTVFSAPVYLHVLVGDLIV